MPLVVAHSIHIGGKLETGGRPAAIVMTTIEYTCARSGMAVKIRLGSRDDTQEHDGSETVGKWRDMTLNQGSISIVRLRDRNDLLQVVLRSNLLV